MSVVFNPRDLVEGPVRLYLGKSVLDAGFPSPPANSVAFGAAWPAGWRAPGYTSRDPLSFGGLSGERTPVFSGQQKGQISSYMGEVSESVSFKLLSRTMQNLKDLANRGVLSQVAPGAGTYGEIRIVWSDTPNAQMALGIEAYGTQGRIFRAYYPVGSFSITDAITYGYGADQASSGIAATFTAEGGPDNPPQWWEILPAL